MSKTKTLKQIEADLVAAKEEVSRIEKLKSDSIKRKFITCKDPYSSKRGCGKKTRLGDLTYIQTNWYTPPRGCSGGDYWNIGEGQYICPKCGFKNRLIKDRENISKLKYLFKEIIQTHED